MIWALISKDLTQHAKPLLIFTLSCLALPVLSAPFTAGGKDGTGYVGLAFGFLGISAPMLLAQWFIGQEKVKGTFKLLRTLPVSGTRMILTKYVTCTAICLLWINGVLFLGPTVCNMMGSQASMPGAPAMLWTSISGMFFVGLSISLFVVFDARIAAQAMIWGMCCIMVCVALAGRFLEGREDEAFAARMGIAIQSGWLAACCWLILGAISFLMVWFAARLFEKRDWSRLEEG